MPMLRPGGQPASRSRPGSERASPSEAARTAGTLLAGRSGKTAKPRPARASAVPSRSAAALGAMIVVDIVRVPPRLVFVPMFYTPALTVLSRAWHDRPHASSDPAGYRGLGAGGRRGGRADHRARTVRAGRGHPQRHAPPPPAAGREPV